MTSPGGQMMWTVVGLTEFLTMALVVRGRGEGNGSYRTVDDHSDDEMEPLTTK
jgi:hypothetical protein